MIEVPHTVCSLLDLFPPHAIGEALEYQATCPNDSLDDWESRHLLAAEYLCSYAEMTYLKRYSKQINRLRTKLDLQEEEQ